MTIRVLLADDQALLRGTFKLLIDTTPDMTVVAEAATGAEAVKQTSEHRPDVVVMDIRMPGLDGIDATRRITSDPELAGSRVLVLTTFEIDEYVAEALHAGASGFVGKGVNPTDLLTAIRTVARGEALLSAVATRVLIDRVLAGPATVPPHGADRLLLLTGREREVLALVAHGLSNDEIAVRLHITTMTAKTHVNRAMTKTGARDRAQLVVLAYRSGLVLPPASPRGDRPAAEGEQ